MTASAPLVPLRAAAALLLLAALAPTLLAQHGLDDVPWRPSTDAPGIATTPLEDSTLDAWFEHVAPDPDELAYLSVPWFASFHEGLAEAARSRRPLLLWVMNGHPLGCT